MEPRHPILVFDDDRDILELTAGVLRDEGYRVVAAASPGEALAHLAAARAGLIIADTHGQTPAARWAGLAALQRAAGATPVIICSAHPADAFEEYASRGFASLLPKPFDLDDLLAPVARLYAPPREA